MSSTERDLEALLPVPMNPIQTRMWLETFQLSSGSKFSKMIMLISRRTEKWADIYCWRNYHWYKSSREQFGNTYQTSNLHSLWFISRNLPIPSPRIRPKKIINKWAKICISDNSLHCVKQQQKTKIKYYLNVHHWALVKYAVISLSNDTVCSHYKRGGELTGTHRRVTTALC